MIYTAEPFLSIPPMQLGESPCWDAARNTLWWVDVRANSLHSCSLADGALQQISLPAAPGMVTLFDDGGLILAVKEVIYHCDRQGKMTELHRQALPEARYNDGKCDPAGRLWVGTLRYDYGASASFLFCLEAGREMRRVLDGVSISNGMAWNAEHTVMYYIDSADRTISAFRYHRETGEISERHIVFTADEGMGMPDGMTIDSDDTLWVAMYYYHMDRGGHGRVLHIDPKDGHVLDEIVVPGAHYVTSCTFGGSELSELYITSADDHMHGDTMICPNAGRIFHLTLPVRGQPVVPFALNKG